MKGDSSGSARLAAADERINRALAGAVERHATKDAGMRGILKRTSVVCHPESEPRKKAALDTEQDSTPHPSVSYGGSPASGAQPSATTSTDQNTCTSDERSEDRTLQDVTRASSKDHNGGDVAMREDGADENSAGHPSPSGQTAEGGSQRRENHVKSDVSNRAPLAARSEKDLRENGATKNTQLLSPRKRHRTDTVDEDRECSSAGALDMTHCDFSARSARDEMRHIFGSSEPDVIIGSDKDQNREMQKEARGSHEIPVRVV